ncbi:BC1881 family protein [Clostridium algidicarnis]|nr:BC1881 family protein [Clostridium algidicarnis]MBU3208703.1 BC1881 family protein [Clostridium algidicarnis]
MNIKDFSTKELVEELIKREGIEITIVGYCEEKEIKASGPAIVIKVID